MKDKSTVKIKYKSKLVTQGRGKNQITYPEYDYVSVGTSHVKRFNNALMVLMGIDGCERNLMDWIADNMTAGNYITNNDITRNNFIEFHKKYKKGGNKVYSDKTVSIAFQRLCAADLLMSKTRGTYMVNPVYYFAGDDASRINAIRMIMEFKKGLETEITVEKK